MTDIGVELATQQIRAVRRLTRLFRIERRGILRRQPAETSRRLIDRRAQLIEDLLRLDARRRSFAPWTSVGLDLAMAGMAREVERLEQHSLERLAELGVKLRQLRGEGIRTGLRDSADGRLLGRG